MENDLVKILEDKIIKSLEVYSLSNKTSSEGLFRKYFHWKFFEKLQELINADKQIGKSLSVKYGLIHNSIHAKIEDNKACEIADFLFVIKSNASEIKSAALIQVKCKETATTNVSQQNLYSYWHPFIFSQPSPKNNLFLR